MRLLNLTIHNFGVFRGRHDFDLTSVFDAHGERRPLIVISGQNGVGKSTLFQTLTLALHGSLALGDQVSRQAYSDFLLSRLHRYMGTGIPVVSEAGSIALSFQYVQSGQVQRILVERNWHRSGQHVTETLNVTRDGKAPEVAREDYQNWLNDLFPPGLASVCFFDAEKLEALSSPEHYRELLGDTLRRLLGLDLVERLQGDLERYSLLQGGGRKESSGRLQKERKERQSALRKLEKELDGLKQKAAELEAEEILLTESLAKQERRLAAEGGTYAERRPHLIEKLKTVKQQAEEVTAQLNEMCGELLPFALAPELCQSLNRQLTRVSGAQSGQMMDAFWQEHLTDLKQMLNEEDIWKGLDVSARDRKQLEKRLIRKLQRAPKAGPAPESPTFHQLAEPERERLQGWITQTLHAVPQQTAFLGERLRGLQSEQQQIEADLQRVPAEESLAPIHAEITRLQTALAKLRKKQAELSEQTGAAQFQRDEQARKLVGISAKLDESQAIEDQTRLAEQSRRALRTYRDALMRQRIAALEQQLVTSFNLICRKEHLIESVSINLDDFSLELRGADNRPLDLTAFSAGERQLYALALLWALRQVSGRQLPLVIDTPLARLDEHHRSRLLHDFVPAVSDQVLLFTTDAEMDMHLLGQAEPYTSRVYQLYYDSQQERTLTDVSGSAPIAGKRKRATQRHAKSVQIEKRRSFSSANLPGSSRDHAR